MNEQSAARQTDLSDQVDEAYRIHGPGLIRFATVLVGPNHARDVLASAMLEILNKSPKVRDPKAYLYQATANQARNFKRGEARRRHRQEATAIAHDASTRQPEAYPEVRAAVEGLSVRQRATVFLAYWEDMGEADIAEHLAISRGSVRRHLARARQHLRRALRDFSE